MEDGRQAPEKGRPGIVRPPGRGPVSDRALDTDGVRAWASIVFPSFLAAVRLAMKSRALENKTFLLLLVVVSLAFAWILWPFYSAVFWGAILAMLFAPLNRRLLRAMPRRRNLAALCTLLVILLIVILPVAMITTSLVQEAAFVYQKLQSGEINIASYLQKIFGQLPDWALSLLDRFGLANIGAVQEKLAAAATQGSKTMAAQAISFGQNTFDFLVSFCVMLYLLFFLLRDGSGLAARIRDAVPLAPEHKRHLFGKFTTVIRATVKGNIAVAAAQGALGGITFWLLGIHAPVLWGVLMAFLSLLPAVGAGLVWGPVALYLFATGAVWPAAILVFVGVAVIGLVDNILRPLLVGKDTKMPDYVVLLSTIGGMALFGLNGFVIGPVVAAMFMATWSLFTSSDSDDAVAADDAPARPVLAQVVPPPPPSPSPFRRD